MSAEEVARRSPSWWRYLTLVAIAAVVVVISLPRLREFALRENENDARVLLGRLASTLEVHAAERPAQVADLVAAGDGLAQWMTDAEYLDDGRLLRRHGYLFDVVRGPGECLAVRAWPWRAGRTGSRVFVDFVGAAPLVHPNAGARWSGPTGAPELATLDADAGWRDAALANE
ncbi:MAG: hypothetical protein HZA52_03805 [Planctomycetes bacterium]|nr:hypothetical protein [Planctomycetota bacterium]